MKITTVAVTVDKKTSAERIARVLLNERLCACVNIIKKIESLYWWKGKVEKTDEYLLIIKTKKNMIDKLIKETRKIHPYVVPEIISFDVDKGNKDYLKWVVKETTK
ncbi:MAG TPA: divalent-cation tolerance protein CutA [Candidatus Goldiibacteriota bacterium]|nr:divalent-cation tolerance protein CutA [Candidatus Goldiibacteriota bacterium]